MTKKILSFVFAVLLTMSFLASAETEYETDISYYEKFKDQNITINVYNWGEYISDGGDGSLNVNSEFEKLTGIKIHYTTFASNEQMYAKLKGEGTSVYDIIIPSEYMIARMIEEDMVEEINMENIPNYALIDDQYKDLLHDPDNLYSVPYMWGMVGLIYNTSMTDEEITSWNSLWDERYFGNILMFENPRDAFGISLARLGYSMNSEDPKELEEAAEELKKQKMLVQAYVMDEIFNKMEGGEAVIAPYYAGDAITMMDENPDLAFAFPEETTNFFVDSFVIPKGSKNKEAAEMYINFMCEPEISAANAEYIGYSTPISAAREMLELDEEIMEISYPSVEVIEKSEIFRELDPEINKLMDRLWTEIRSYNESANDWIAPIFILSLFLASITIIVVRALRKRRNIQ
jgi:spermidine/putrescine transport system substrate-binding protein